MKRNYLTTFLLAAALTPAVALACDGNEHAVQTVSVKDGATWAKSKAATFVDVNGADTRAKQGIIPGAILLTSTDFAATELPAEKSTKLVFYCASTQCGASKMAAKKALSQGYANVWVLPDGIKGWREAGNDTSPFTGQKPQT